MELTGAEIFVRCLAEQGIDYVFGYPGGAVLPIYDALDQQDKVKHVLVRHEQAATHAADGYARATGRPGVVLVTSGPGATNAVTGIATAYMDSIPMVILTGQVPTPVIGSDAFQEVDRHFTPAVGRDPAAFARGDASVPGLNFTIGFANDPPQVGDIIDRARAGLDDAPARARRRRHALEDREQAQQQVQIPRQQRARLGEPLVFLPDVCAVRTHGSRQFHVVVDQQQSAVSLAQVLELACFVAAAAVKHAA